MGEGQDQAGLSKHRTSRSAKIIIALQTLIIVFLGYWAVEEYQNNIYFQSYVNTTLQTNMLPIGAAVVGIPALAGLGLFFRRRRATESLLVGSDIQSPKGSFGSTRSSATGSSESASPLYAELSSRFGQSIANPSSTSDQSNQNRQPVLQRTDQSSGSRIKTGPGGLPVLERVEPRQQTLEPKEGIQGQRYQAPKEISGSPLVREAGYRPTAPSFPRQPDNPGLRQPPSSAPINRPSTIVTGVMGPGPRPYAPPPAQTQSPIRQTPMTQPVQDRWEPGTRPPAPLASMPPRPSSFNPTSSPSSNSSFRSAGSNPPAPGLGRVGLPNATGVESQPGLHRIEPVQAVANRLPWPKKQPSTSNNYEDASSSSREQGAEAQTNSYSDSLTSGKPLQPLKRDDKREASGDNAGS